MSVLCVYCGNFLFLQYEQFSDSDGGQDHCAVLNTAHFHFPVLTVSWLGRRSESVCCVEYTIYFLSMVSLLAGMKVKANRLSLVLLFLDSMSSLLVRVETRASVLGLVLPT